MKYMRIDRAGAPARNLYKWMYGMSIFQDHKTADAAIAEKCIFRDAL
ncbi:MAG: hypothetical protein ACI9YO_000316 [Gammaproteobacteria bacterium]|jgi:hypothetical protein